MPILYYSGPTIPRPQYNAWVTVVFLSGSASVVASLLIARICIKKTDKLYHRLVLWLSLVDIGTSTSILLQPFLTEYYPALDNWMSHGTHSSCTAIAATFGFFGFSGPTFNALLALYFHFSICRNVNERKLTIWLERPVVCYIVLVSAALQSIGVAADAAMYHEFALICVFGKATRFLARHRYFFHVATGLLAGSAAVIGVITTVLTNRLISKKIERTQGYSITDTSRQIKREANVQSILYCVAFVNSFAWTTAAIILGTKYVLPDEVVLTKLFWLKLLFYAFFPLQGVLNCVIYLRPHTVRWKRAVPAQSWGWAIQQATRGLVPPRAPVRRRNANKNLRVNCPEEGVAGELHLPSTPSSQENVNFDEDFDCGVGFVTAQDFSSGGDFVTAEENEASEAEGQRLMQSEMSITAKDENSANNVGTNPSRDSGP